MWEVLKHIRGCGPPLVSKRRTKQAALEDAQFHVVRHENRRASVYDGRGKLRIEYWFDRQFGLQYIEY